MPSWFMRVAWKCRGKRRVRLQMLDGGKHTVEGIRLGRWSGSYILMQAVMLVEEGRTVSLDGVIEVPVGNVYLVQVLS